MLTDAQKAELAQLFQNKDGSFDEEQFAEAFARELKFALAKAQGQRAEKAPKTRVGKALKPIVDFFVALATSVRNWRVGRGMDAETGAPLQAQSVLEAFLQRQREEAKAMAELNRRRWEQSKQDGAALAEALERSPHQIVLDDDGTPLQFHDPTKVTKHDGIGEDVLDALNEMLITQSDAHLYSKELGDVLLSFGRFADPEHRFNGKGVLHIIEERMRPDKDNLTLDEAIEVVLKVAEAATRGKIIEHQGNRYGIELNGYNAVVADNGTFREIITGYKIGKKKRSGVETDAIRRSEDYAPDFYGRLRVEGAEPLNHRIAKLLEGRQVEKSVETLEAELSALEDENWDLLTAFNRAKRAGDQQEIDVSKQALDDNEARLKATEEALAKARKKRNQRIAKAKKRGDYSGHPEQYHITVWSGAPNEYAVPSMAFVGTGTGGNSEGRGLYSSGVRGGGAGQVCAVCRVGFLGSDCRLV